MRFNHSRILPLFRATFRRVHGPLTLEQGTKVNTNFLKLIRVVEDDQKATGIRQTAYMIATAYHETGHDFEPKDETGRGANKLYGQPIPIFKNEHRTYYGRGLVQLTWLKNYATASLLCGVDFIQYPHKVKEWPYCYEIMADGMRRGWFTGLGLGDFIGPVEKDYYSARRIVNGLDRAKDIAEYAESFEEILHASKEG